MMGREKPHGSLAKSVPGKGNNKCNGLIRSISGIITKCVVTEEVYGT